MTPAIQLLKKLKVSFKLHEYETDTHDLGYGEAAAKALGVPTNIMFKTLLASSEKNKPPCVAALVPVSSQLNLKHLAKASKYKALMMADPNLAEKSTGYLVGGISPFGQKKSLPIFVDSSITELEEVFVSGGKRGLQISISPEDLIDVLNARSAHLVSP